MQVTSPDISVLDFSALFDISKAVPEITLANASSGPDLASCTWWYVITTPSGTHIHTGVATAPDMAGAWVTKVISEAWPQPFGQVEWDGAVPYTVVLYVKDGANTIFSLEKSILICRPAGNTHKSIGNFGAAKTRVSVQCAKARLVAEDETNYMYRGMVGTAINRKYTLSYPGDEDGNIPDPFVASGHSNIIIPIAFSGEGYRIYFDAVQDYTNNLGMTVRVKYKFKKVFNVACNIDLCPLICDIAKLYDSLEGKACSQETKDKLLRINAKLNMVQIAIMQPLCGWDVAALIEDIKQIGGFSCNCVGLPSSGINGTLDPSANFSISFDTCGDIQAGAVVNANNILMTIKDKKVRMILDPASPNAFTIAETVDVDSCERVYTLKVDNDLLAANFGCCPVTLPIYMHEVDPNNPTNTSPAGCPNNHYQPAKDVYDPTDTTVIGIATNAIELVALLNGNPDWSALGTAYVLGFCQVGFFFNPGVAAGDKPTAVHVAAGTPVIDPVDPTAGDYQVKIYDYCLNYQLSPSQVEFVSTIWVQFQPGDPVYQLRAVLDYNDMLTKLNAHPNKPAGMTLQAVPSDISSVKIHVAQAPASTSVVKIWLDHVPFLLMGANYHKIAGLNSERVNVLELNANIQLGTVCNVGGSGHPWHSLRVNSMTGQFIYFVDSATGLLHKIDVSNTLQPFQVLTVQLGNFGGTAWTGLPLNAGSPSHYDVFFQQSEYSSTNLLYILESSSGSMYQYDVTSDTVIASFQDRRMIGKNPRMIKKDKLYFTHHGDLETATGQNSTVARKCLVYIDLTAVFNAAAIHVVPLAVADTEEPWAMTHSTMSGFVYVVMKSGDVLAYDPNTDTITNTFSNVFAAAGGFIVFCNAITDGWRMWVCCNGKGTYYVDIDQATGALANGGAVAFDPLISLNNNVNVNHFNYHPIDGKCYGLVTFGEEDPAGVARFTQDGKFIDVTAPGTDGFYNVIVRYVSQFFPNTLC